MHVISHETAYPLAPGDVVKFIEVKSKTVQEGTVVDFFINKTPVNEVFVRILVGTTFHAVLGQNIVAVNRGG